MEGLEYAVNFLEKYKGKIFGELCEQVKSRNEDMLTTLNFGNVWNGNIFVLKDEEKKSYPGALLIDPKVSRTEIDSGLKKNENEIILLLLYF